MSWLPRPMIKRLGLGVASASVVVAIATAALASEEANENTDAAALAQSEKRVAEQPIRTKSFYIGAGLGVSRLHPEADCDCLTVGESGSSGFSVAVGYDFSPRFSAELYGADLGQSGIDFLGTDVGDVDYQVFGLSVLGTFYRQNPSSERRGLSLYSRAGIGYLNTQSDLDYRRDHPQHISLGVGAEYGFSGGFSVRGELNSYDTDAQFLQVSLVKRFGDSNRSNALPALPVVTPAPVNVTPKAAPIPQAPDAPEETFPIAYFDFDEHTLTTEAKQAVASMAAQLENTNEIIVIAGHTDDMGSDAYNQALSTRRANTVQAELIQLGIAPNRLRLETYGETRPVASNTTANGRALNRRVEVSLTAQ